MCTVDSRASGLAAKWCWLHNDKAQDAVSVLCVLWYTYVFMVNQLRIALVYVLMYYFGNIATAVAASEEI